MGNIVLLKHRKNKSKNGKKNIEVYMKVEVNQNSILVAASCQMLFFCHICNLLILKLVIYT